MLGTYLNKSWPGSHSIVSDAVVATREDSIRLSRETLRDGDREAPIDGMCLDKCGTSDGNKSSVHLCSLGSVENVVLYSISITPEVVSSGINLLESGV